MIEKVIKVLEAKMTRNNKNYVIDFPLSIDKDSGNAENVSRKSGTLFQNKLLKNAQRFKDVFFPVKEILFFQSFLSKPFPLSKCFQSI